jgi:hypothetical protein
MAVAAIIPSAVPRGVPLNWHSAPRTPQRLLTLCVTGEDSVGKQRKKVLFKPLFQLQSTFARGKQGKSLAKFSNAYNAQVQRSIVLSLNPIAYPKIGLWPC